MTDKIDKLTPEQEALIPVIRDKWIEIGLSTEPTDRANAERGVDLAYQAAGLKPPKTKIWLASPLASYLKTFRLHYESGKSSKCGIRCWIRCGIRCGIRCRIR